MTPGQFVRAISQWEKRTGKKYPWPPETPAQTLKRRLTVHQKWARELAANGEEFPREWVSPEEAVILDTIREMVVQKRKGR